MKNHTGVIDNSCFPKSYTGETCRNCHCNKPTLVEQFQTLTRKWLPTIVAGGTIGTIVLLSIYLFLFQLAEHGF